MSLQVRVDVANDFPAEDGVARCATRSSEDRWESPAGGKCKCARGGVNPIRSPGRARNIPRDTANFARVKIERQSTNESDTTGRPPADGLHDFSAEEIFPRDRDYYRVARARKL